MIHDEMSPSEMLCAFLDGELPEAETSTLFYAVAQSPELQAEMRQHVALHNSIQSVPLAVPAHLKESIFLKTGMAREVRDASIIAGGAWSNTLAMVFKSRAFAMLIAGVMASTATFAFMNKTADLASVPESTMTMVIPEAKPEIVYKTIEKISDESLAEAFSAGFKKGIAEGMRNAERLYLAALEEDGVQRPRFTKPVEEEPRMVTIGPDEQNVEPAINTQRPAISTMSSSIFGNMNPLPVEIPVKASNFSLLVRGSAAYSFPQLDAPSPGNPAFNNMTIGLQYHPNTNHTFGVEVGRENFIQKYNGVIDSRRYRIEQNYQAVWAGASYRYTLAKIKTLGEIRPFASVMAGGTEVGPLLKSSAGVMYEYDRRVEFTAAVEGTALFYNFQNTLFNTKKLGVSYGVSVRL